MINNRSKVLIPILNLNKHKKNICFGFIYELAAMWGLKEFTLGKPLILLIRHFIAAFNFKQLVFNLTSRILT